MRTNWIHLAVASGLCAATNGLFAKLTTTTLTTSLAGALAGMLSLPTDSKTVEYVVRSVFFGLNLVFNGIMWGLFTAALAKGDSATTVSVVNTSANFMATAMFGWWIFSEALPGTWWVGAAMLVAGSVIISRRDTEGKAKGLDAGGLRPPAATRGHREWVVRDIVDSRWHQGALQYRVEWEGHADKTWEPWYHVNDNAALPRFHARYPLKPGPVPEGAELPSSRDSDSLELRRS